jgi:hypothetical protein
MIKNRLVWAGFSACPALQAFILVNPNHLVVDHLTVIEADGLVGAGFHAIRRFTLPANDQVELVAGHIFLDQHAREKRVRLTFMEQGTGQGARLTPTAQRFINL